MSNVRQVKTAGELIPGRQLLQQVSRPMAPDEVCRQGCFTQLCTSCLRLALWHQPIPSTEGFALKEGSSGDANRFTCACSCQPSSLPQSCLEGPRSPAQKHPSPPTMQHACL